MTGYDQSSVHYTHVEMLFQGVCLLRSSRSIHFRKKKRPRLLATWSAPHWTLAMIIAKHAALLNIMLQGSMNYWAAAHTSCWSTISQDPLQKTLHVLVHRRHRSAVPIFVSRYIHFCAHCTKGMARGTQQCKETLAAVAKPSPVQVCVH
jgi:hypothetical protein